MTGRIRKGKRDKNYTVIPNDILKAKDLTWKAKGLLCYLISLSDDWEVYKADLVNRSKDGYDSMLSGWNELENLGYIETKKTKEGNLFSGYEYIIHDSRARDFTEPGNPGTGNPQLISNSLKKVTLKENNKSEKFDKFWQLYPIKVDKKKCESRWEKLTDSDIMKIEKSIDRFLSEKPFAQYRFPNPLTYLNGERWNDNHEVDAKPIGEQKDMGDLMAAVRGW